MSATSAGVNCSGCLMLDLACATISLIRLSSEAVLSPSQSSASWHSMHLACGDGLAGLHVGRESRQRPPAQRHQRRTRGQWSESRAGHPSVLKLLSASIEPDAYTKASRITVPGGIRRWMTFSEAGDDRQTAQHQVGNFSAGRTNCALEAGGWRRRSAAAPAARRAAVRGVSSARSARAASAWTAPC